MTPILLMFLVSAIFLQLKAIEYRGVPGLATGASVVAWVCYAVTMVLLITGVRLGG